jgi:UDP-2-acetamido-2,6-beta-L-arabino-hexul-4-ose reductase
LTVGITGPRGFIAGHLARRLAACTAAVAGSASASIPPAKQHTVRIAPCSRADCSDPNALGDFVQQCDAIVHLAGMNRGDEREIYDVNASLIDRLILSLDAAHKRPHVIFASSTQRDRSNAYGRSKKYGEDRLRQWAARSAAPLTILVIPNVFGPGCRPYYNSVVATFCHQLAHGQRPVVIDDQNLELVWINDLTEAIAQLIQARRPGIHEARVAGSACLSVSELLSKLQAMRESYFEENIVPDLSQPFDASLYTTFLSYIDFDDHCHRPRLHTDTRGQLFEVLRLAGGGQIFFSTTRPGVIRGNHFHSRKVEWFCVVRGEAAIRIRRVGDDQVREFRVSGSSPEFISIPALCTHQIENVGAEDLLTMFWCNEIFQPADPDTFFEKVA